MPFSYTCTDFLRTLLENCIGTVMIEWEQWNFPSPSFDRGYFNSRLKQAMPINELTHINGSSDFSSAYLILKTERDVFRNPRP